MWLLIGAGVIASLAVGAVMMAEILHEKIVFAQSVRTAVRVHSSFA